MFRAIVTIEPRYFVSVGSTWLTFIAARITSTTRLISHRPTIQNATAARILRPTAAAVVPRKVRIASKSMACLPLVRWGPSSLARDDSPSGPPSEQEAREQGDETGAAGLGHEPVEGSRHADLRGAIAEEPRSGGLGEAGE